MKIVAECGKCIMLINQNDKLNERSLCRVYDIDRGILAPTLPAGSWSARMFPWIKPTKDYSKELKHIEAIIKNEQKQGL